MHNKKAPAPRVESKVMRIAFRFGLALFPQAVFCFAIAGAQVASPVRVADAPCANCHREIFEKYLKTPMANASGSAAERFKPGTLNHKASGVIYKISMHDGQPMLSFQEVHNPFVNT